MKCKEIAIARKNSAGSRVKTALDEFKCACDMIAGNYYVIL
jgi:hypothetical protein